MSFINKMPNAAWAGILGILAVVFQVFIEAQWPGTPPAWAIALSTGLVMAAKLVTVLLPQPVEPVPPPGVQAQARGMAEAKPEPGKLRRWLVG